MQGKVIFYKQYSSGAAYNKGRVTQKIIIWRSFPLIGGYPQSMNNDNVDISEIFKIFEIVDIFEIFEIFNIYKM